MKKFETAKKGGDSSDTDADQDPSLKKRYKLDLSESDTSLKVGLKWENKPEFTGACDLDGSLVMISEIGETKDAVFYNQLVSKCGSITHSGDSRDGLKEGFDEVMTIDISKLDISINYMAIIINNFNERGFGNVDNALCKVFGDQNQSYH